jgi:hypothetical protein
MTLGRSDSSTINWERSKLDLKGSEVQTFGKVDASQLRGDVLQLCRQPDVRVDKRKFLVSRREQTKNDAVPSPRIFTYSGSASVSLDSAVPLGFVSR